MTLGTFLDSAYAILVDEHRQLSGNLIEALENAEMWRAGGPPIEVGDGALSSNDLPPAVGHQVERQNENSLSQLQQMMSGVSFGGPRV